MTLIGEEASVHGLLSVKGPLRVEGSVDGDITDVVVLEVGKKGRVKGNVAVESISIAGKFAGDVAASRHVDVLTGSSVKGNVAAESVSIAGKLDGDVVASRRVEILAGASLKGNLRTPNLRVDDGAFFEGTCSMREATDEREVTRRAPSSAVIAEPCPSRPSHTL
jgi:cytoskeletal protein CcmA (bactofilin family)